MYLGFNGLEKKFRYFLLHMCIFNQEKHSAKNMITKILCKLVTAN